MSVLLTTLSIIGTVIILLLLFINLIAIAVSIVECFWLERLEYKIMSFIVYIMLSMSFGFLAWLFTIVSPFVIVWRGN